MSYDPVFSARMARLADDMGLTVLNPALQTTIAQHRSQRRHVPVQSNAVPTTSAVNMPLPSRESDIPQTLPTALPPVVAELSAEESLRAQVLAIDPRATFIRPNLDDSKPLYCGPIAASHQREGFAQHLGRSQYILHSAPFPLPSHGTGESYDIRYRAKQIQIAVTAKSKGKGRAE